MSDTHSLMHPRWKQVNLNYFTFFFIFALMGSTHPDVLPTNTDLIPHIRKGRLKFKRIRSRCDARDFSQEKQTSYHISAVFPCEGASR
jgi:hypothetical protein